jgi:hypothetical protein
LDVLLVSPGGQSVLFMSDVGGSTALTSANQATLTFDDAAPASLTTSTLVTGTYKPTNLAGAVDTFLAPAPGSGYGATLSTFAGGNPNGTWNLFIRDNATGPNTTAGSVNGGYRIEITTRP